MKVTEPFAAPLLSWPLRRPMVPGVEISAVVLAELEVIGPSRMKFEPPALSPAMAAVIKPPVRLKAGKES